jgi:hypothetical protein
VVSEAYLAVGRATLAEQACRSPRTVFPYPGKSLTNLPCYANLISLNNQMAGDWVTTYCLEEDGFPKVLYATIVRLGIMDHPEYVGREYMERGTEACQISVHIGASDKYPEVRPWSVTMTGHRLKDTYQLTARKALWYLCQLFEWHLGSTPMKYFPPLDRNRPAWAARIRNLGSLGSLEAAKKDPTIVAMSGYLLSLDDLCNQLCQRARALTQRAEEAEVRWRKSRLDLAQSEARVANAESRVALAEEKLWEQADHHSKLLRDISLVDRVKRKDPHPQNSDGTNMLEGTPVYLFQPRRRICGPASPTPPASPRTDDEEGPRETIVGTNV